MPVNTEHPDYAAMSGKWKRCRDVYAGQDAVHTAGEAYLPKLKDQTADDYNSYRLRATFYNASYRTISGLAGMLFRQPPQVKLPPKVEEMTDDITMSGVPLDALVAEVARDALDVGRVGLLVDYPVAPEGMTQADAAKQNLRPTIQLYKTESIINWKTASVNNQNVLVLLVLRECEKVAVDEFKYSDVERWRVLDLVDQKYRVRRFERKGEQDVQIGTDIYPLMNGKIMDFIPFVFIGTDDLTERVDNPPLIDLVDMNLSHYRTTADYEHGCHFTGLPTAVVKGHKMEKEGDKLYIGSATAWVFPSKDADAKFLEFTGQGLGSLKDNLDRKEMQMAVLGARMLEPQKKGAETAQSQSIHRKGEESMLAAVASTISMGVERALGWFCDWAGVASEDVEYAINDDFYPEPMTPEELTALVGAWQQGAISDQTLFDNLQQGEIISSTTTLEEEQARIGDKGMRLNGQNPDGTAPALPQLGNVTHNITVQGGGPKRKKITTPSGQTYRVEEE